MQVRDLCNLFGALDDLQGLLVETLGKWNPPELIVLGGKNYGNLDWAPACFVGLLANSHCGHHQVLG